ncbi:MAG: phosphoadenosine phosphosulfate reductase family protein [Candidatus Jordarchaeales archaeon]
MGYGGLKPSQLLSEVKAEVERPFEEKLERAVGLIRLFADRDACVACSFGKDSLAVLWLCLQENPNIPVVFNNTGVEYFETLEFKEQLARDWRLNLIETKPETSYWQVMESLKGRIDDGRKWVNKCCYELKEKPFKRVVREYGFKFCFTGLTALESRARMWVACERGMQYYSRKDGVTKVHPILYWTPEEVWRFTREKGIPVNPAYAKYGLNRIGCVPCTSHRGWRAQLAKVNPAIYKHVMERYFKQRLLMP